MCERFGGAYCAADLVRRKAAWLYDEGRPAGAEANIAKYLASEASWEAANAALDCFGGFGFAQEYDIERKFPRDAAVPHRAGQQQPRAGLRRPARARPAALVLSQVSERAGYSCTETSRTGPLITR
jgi:alkylation response protein AidB-like acyl-CoA dehydrogenase